jgi:hypothetical protein
MGADKNSFSKELGLYPRLKRLGRKAKASTKELEQQ